MPQFIQLPDGAVESLIVEPLTEDGLFGKDRFGQSVLATVHEAHVSFTMVRDPGDKLCEVCGHGWARTGPSIADQHHWNLFEMIEENPNGGASYRNDSLVHLSCFIRFLAINDRMEVHAALCDARLRFNGLIAQDSIYWRAPDPWYKRLAYKATLKDHGIDILIGMRKRVWEITLTPTVNRLSWFEAAATEFKGDNVTKEFSDKEICLHAWSTEDMRRYIERLAMVGGLVFKSE